MKVCPQCGETYAEFVDFCFADGTVLALEAAAPVPDAPDAFDAPPPPKMLQGSQQRASYTRSATPVPRARRPGRSLIQAEGAYSPPQDIEQPAAQRTPTPPPAPSAPEPEQMYGDAPEELEGAAPDDQALDGDVEETWSDDGDEDFFRPQTPAPPPMKQGQVAMSKSDHEQWVDDEDEDERGGGLGVFALAGAGFLAVAVVALAAVFAITTMMLPGEPDGPTETPDPTPTQPEPVEPAPVDPVPVPEPVEPQPEATDPVEPQPDTPEPVEPEPDTPGPAQPVPTQPAPVTQPEPVAAVPPTPRPDRTPVAVKFTSTPDGGTIYVDGTAIGTTAFTRSFPSGQHRVRIEKDGYETFEKVMSFQPGMGGVDATLTPVGGVAPQPVPAPAPETVPAPEAVPAPVPEPAPEPAPAPAAEMITTMFFMPEIEPNKAFVRYGGNKVGTIGGKLMFPSGGGKLTVEFQAPDGQVWTETVVCGAPERVGSMAKLIITGATCPGIKGTPP